MTDQPLPQPTPKLIVHIEFDPITKGLSVQAPPDLIVAFGLMELAKGTIMREQQSAQRSSIIGVPMMPPPFRR